MIIVGNLVKKWKCILLFHAEMVDLEADRSVGELESVELGYNSRGDSKKWK